MPSPRNRRAMVDEEGKGGGLFIWGGGGGGSRGGNLLPMGNWGGMKTNPHPCKGGPPYNQDHKPHRPSRCTRSIRRGPRAARS